MWRWWWSIMIGWWRSVMFPIRAAGTFMFTRWRSVRPSLWGRRSHLSDDILYHCIKGLLLLLVAKKAYLFEMPEGGKVQLLLYGGGSGSCGKDGGFAHGILIQQGKEGILGLLQLRPQQFHGLLMLVPQHQEAVLLCLAEL